MVQYKEPFQNARHKRGGEKKKKGGFSRPVRNIFWGFCARFFFFVGGEGKRRKNPPAKRQPNWLSG